jgi:hypothetical protein
MKCLLIETKDKRKFFTHKKNLVQLTEFAKTFNSNLFIIELERGEILELEKLALAICDPNYKKNEGVYTIKEQIREIKEVKATRTVKNERADLGEKIRNFIITEFTAKKPISIKKIKNKFKKHEMSDATLYNHLRKAKAELENQGYKFLKIKAGIYKKR